MGRAKQPKFIRAPKTAQTKLRWRPHFVGEHAIETSHLDRCDRGSLDALLDRYWKNQGPLPDNDRFLSNVAKTSLGQWQGGVRQQMAAFFVVAKGVWRNWELDAQLARIGASAASMSARGRKAAQKRWADVREARDRQQLALPLEQADGKTDGKVIAVFERRLMREAEEVLGVPVMRREGGKWRLRCRQRPALVGKVLAEVRMQIKQPCRRTDPIRALGAYAENLWKFLDRHQAKDKQPLAPPHKESLGSAPRGQV